MTPTQRLDRLRGNVLEGKRFVRSNPDAAIGYMEGIALELEVLRDELTRPGRDAEFDALMTETAKSEPRKARGVIGCEVPGCDAPANRTATAPDGYLGTWCHVHAPAEAWEIGSFPYCKGYGCIERASHVIQYANFGVISYLCPEHAPRDSQAIRDTLAEVDNPTDATMTPEGEDWARTIGKGQQRIIDGSKLDWTPRPVDVPPELILRQVGGAVNAWNDLASAEHRRLLTARDPLPWAVVYVLFGVVTAVITLYLTFGRNP